MREWSAMGDTLRSAVTEITKDIEQGKQYVFKQMEFGQRKAQREAERAQERETHKRNGKSWKQQMQDMLNEI